MKRNKMLSSISLIMFFLIHLNIMLPLISYAGSPIDYKDLIFNLKEEKNIKFNTPMSQIKITYNGNTYTSIHTRDTVETVNALNFIKVDKGKEFKVGDTITVSSSSTTGSGSSITAYDWQIGKDYTWNGPSDYDYKSTSSFTYTLDRPGTWVIFLNVRDNYKISGTNFENWSDWGNWRTEEPPPFQYTGAEIKGWYFAALKFEVIDIAKPKAEFEIHYGGLNRTDNYSSPVEVEKYPITVNLIDRSTAEKSNIMSWEWQKKSPSGSWQSLSNAKNPNVSINQNLETFRLKVRNTEGKESDWVEHVFVSKLKGGNEPPVGNIRAVLDGPEMAEWGDTIKLDSSRSTSTSTIVKREYWRRTSSQSTWTLQPSWENVVKPSEKTIDNGTASYIEYKLVIKDSDGRTAEDTHRVNMVESVDPEIRANLVFDPRQGFEKVKISLEDYLNDNEIEVNYWITAEHSSYVKTSLGHFYFFQNVDDSQIRKYENNQSAISNDHNFIEYIRISTRDNPQAIEDAVTRGTFKVRPSNPTIKAALLLKANLVNLDPDFATAYHTVEFDVDSIPPTTELTIPYPFYPKEINNPKQKTITWSYHSEQDIPYSYSIVSLYKKAPDGYYEEVFRNRVMTERYLVVQGNADEEYEIEVRVVDQLNKESRRVDGEFTIIGAVPVIDIELDNFTVPDVLKIEVYNNTPEEIEKLFPTSYTYWTIHDVENNLVMEGEGEAPKSVGLDEKFDRGKYTVTQHAINTIGATAYARKDFEISSLIDFTPEPVQQFEDDMIKLIDKSKYVTEKSWHIRGNNDTEFSPLYLNWNNEFTRDAGTYQVKLQGKGYFQYFGDTTREVTKTVIFLSTKPTAAYRLGGNMKMYKEITLDGSISEQMTESRLQEKYPILFDHAKTMFVIEPITEPNGEVDATRTEYILGHGRAVENNQVIFRARKDISIRIDKEGWYRGSYKVYNGRKESDWYVEEFYVSPELLPSVDINVGSTIVYRDPENRLKPKLEVIVDYSSPDDKISLTKSKLLISYDKNNDGDFTNDGPNSEQWIMKDSSSLFEYFSNVNASWGENKATFNLQVDNPDKNFFGRFKFEFMAIEEPTIPNKDDLGEAPIMIADTFLLDDKKKIILVDNDKPKIFLETTTNNSVTLWILEDSNREFTNDEIRSMIQSLEIERIKVEVYIIDAKTNKVRKFEI